MEFDTSNLSAIAAADIQLKTILALIRDILTAIDLHAINRVPGSQRLKHDPRWQQVLQDISTITTHLSNNVLRTDQHRIHKLNYLIRLLHYILVFDSWISESDFVGYNIIKTGYGRHSTIQEAFMTFRFDRKVPASKAVESALSISELRTIAIIDLHFEEVYLNGGYRSELPKELTGAAIQLAQGIVA
ncbi:hypothetical protein EJ05DRAFT_488211 [Pseudovirgaria hyperparasitica]|uniref:Uncharacterized protein n=1 Tax=Pseudovirgaria hyperparasitica TaxID=470096 RepID=A0A6A6VYT7_9PEZI|nr:uncharacterized protein EJ05DRAFT_488211 [Pseudovirgaria hyperparasitica]KAF2755443.1 hypothetical protein EJ05DRAFT_488211 [Pseudovirgaria hyperparasitica]